VRILAGAGIVAAVAAAFSLWLGARRRSGRVRLGYLWLAAAAALWCLGVITEQILATPVSGVTVGLTFSDFPELLAPPAAAIGVAMLAVARGGAAHDSWRALGQRVAAPPVIPRLADGYVLAASLFVIGWITMLGPDYARSGAGPGSFTVQLVHPLAGLVIVGLLLPMVGVAGWQAVPPFVAVLLATVSDALGVSARLSGAAPGPAQQAVLLAAFCVLGLTPWVARRAEPARPAADTVRSDTVRSDTVRSDTVRSDTAQLDTARSDIAPSGTAPSGTARSAAAAGEPPHRPPTTLAAPVSAAAAAVLVCLWGTAGAHGSPALVLTGSVAVIVLAARWVGVVTGLRPRPLAQLESVQRFRELADLTSDAVLVCGPGGVVRYASPAVRDYGYSTDSLSGTRLEDLVHPEDRPGSRRAVRAALSRPAGEPPERFGCRVRAADGTWRHVEATVSPYRAPSSATQLLITARDISDQVALRGQVAHLTFHDGLTGLPNRAYLEDQAATVLATAEAGQTGQADESEPAGAQAGVIFLDLDGFTAVNDSVGHRAGDLLLAQAGRRLRAAVAPSATVVRWGGDEFAVLIGESGGAQDIVDLAERLARSVAASPFRVADRDISLTASLGVAFAGAEPPSVVLRNADVAMARAKASGGGRVEIFATQMHEEVVHRLELTSDLQRAITDGQLVVQYQPVMDLATSRVNGAEALVRWWRGGTAVPPGDFLDVAEESGLIVPLGDWVLRQACAQAAQWARTVPGIGVSVNFSLRQVNAPGFPATVLAALEDTGLPATALTLEVAERVLVDASGPVVAHLAELRRAGVRLAIDDFGTGYASLANLRRLPVDIIKIDPSFVAGLGEDETLTLLTRTIVKLGRDLGISVVAEGIESSQQLGLLRDMGCGLGQGYLVAPPMSAIEMEPLITAVPAEPGGAAVPAAPGGATSPPLPPAAAGPGPQPEAVVSLSETELHGS
jgi:diguanylate cyclase (GGDEF)-like protein/PAS domain S-box-containing protein